MNLEAFEKWANNNDPSLWSAYQKGQEDSKELLGEMARELEWALDSLMRGECISETWHNPTYKRIMSILDRCKVGME